MKKFTFALLAMAAALAITPAAKATTLCSADSSAITSSTVCSEGNFTFTFSLVSPIPNSDTLYFGAGTTGSGDSANLDFQILGQLPADIDLIYEVQGPAGAYTLDNSFAGSGTPSLTEDACTVNFPMGGCPVADQLAGFTNYSGADMSSSFTSNGTFYVDKDASADTYSQFNDSVSVTPTATPEPSSLVLLGTGLLGLAFVAFRKAKPARTALNLSL